MCLAGLLTQQRPYHLNRGLTKIRHCHIYHRLPARSVLHHVVARTARACMTDPRSRSNIHVGVKRNPPDLNPDSLHHDGSFGKYMQARRVAYVFLHMCICSEPQHTGYQQRMFAFLLAGQEPQAA